MYSKIDKNVENKALFGKKKLTYHSRDNHSPILIKRQVIYDLIILKS